ncbi:MAG: hypothetical protein Q4D42_02585 [Eubacteriales bacterium]|nr:hypothetical protein [Eubacteriales bacterium]
MPENGQKQKNYRVERIAEEPEQETTDQLEQDPLEQLPDVSAQTGGLPIVTFILICLAACCIILLNKAFVSTSLVFSAGCLLFAAILVFGIAALIRGMFVKLYRQKEPQHWYAISAVVMAVGVFVGIVVGILAC